LLSPDDLPPTVAAVTTSGSIDALLLLVPALGLPASTTPTADLAAQRATEREQSTAP
jgi:hypothetical protein